MERKLKFSRRNGDSSGAKDGSMKQDARTGYPGRGEAGGKEPRFCLTEWRHPPPYISLSPTTWLLLRRFYHYVTKLPSSRKYLKAFLLFCRNINEQFFHSRWNFVNQRIGFSPRWFYRYLTLLIEYRKLFHFLMEKLLTNDFLSLLKFC